MNLKLNRSAVRLYLQLTIALALLPSTAWAYPSAVVFSPNGEAHVLGSVGLLAYTSTNFSPGHVTPGASWFGIETGLLPRWAYGDSGVSFGGLEVGFDVITPYALDTVKPVFNAKLGLVTEGTYSPSVAVGVMEVSPAFPAMNFLFVSATKTLGPAGRLTLGFGDNTGSSSVFYGSFPFTTGAKQAVMAAYESPLLFDRIGFVADYFGGVSEVSDLYTGVTLSLSANTTVALGAFFDNDRTAATGKYDGMFAYLTKNFDATKLFDKQP
jgi:hypothetical protein